MQHTFWCDHTSGKSQICAVLEWRKRAKSGGTKTKLPKKPGYEEMLDMHKKFCEADRDPEVQETAPCRQLKKSPELDGLKKAYEKSSKSSSGGGGSGDEASSPRSTGGDLAEFKTLSEDTKQMQQWWCEQSIASGKESAVCGMLKYRVQREKMRAEEPLPVGEELLARPARPKMDEMHMMHEAWCALSGNEESHPCTKSSRKMLSNAMKENDNLQARPVHRDDADSLSTMAVRARRNLLTTRSDKSEKIPKEYMTMNDIQKEYRLPLTEHHQARRDAIKEKRTKEGLEAENPAPKFNPKKHEEPPVLFLNGEPWGYD